MGLNPILRGVPRSAEILSAGRPRAILMALEANNKTAVRPCLRVASHSHIDVTASFSSFPWTATSKMSKTNTRTHRSETYTLPRSQAHILRITGKSSPPQTQSFSTLDDASISSPALASRMPPNSWDSHMHVVGDLKTYPLHASAQYIPHPHLLPQALASIYSSVAIPNIVFVQPSIYGNDNSCLLDALRELGPERGRAVVTFDPETISQETLQEWHALGVRGVRLNFKSVGKAVDAEDLQAQLKKYADVIRPFGWVLQLWIGLEAVPILEPLVSDLGVKVCLDHFAGPDIPLSFTSSPNPDPYSLPGFQSLINLLSAGNTFVKLSAPYRLTNDAEENRDLEPLAKEILRVAGKKYVVFATDWPHTRFDGIDIAPFAERCLDWCGEDEELKERFFRGNAEDLWDVQR